MKIAFDCHIIFDSGNREMEPTIVEAIRLLKEGKVEIEYIPLWIDKPSIIIKKKENVNKD